MRRTATPLTLVAMIAGFTPTLAERRLGLHRLDGAVDLIWTAIEENGHDAWAGAYTIRGHLFEAAEGDEALLAGWSVHCDGVMSGSGQDVMSDSGSCRFESGTGSAILARYSGGPGRWPRLALRIGFYGGTDAYRTLYGEGTIERLMHLPHTAPVGWGYLAGAIAWHRD